MKTGKIHRRILPGPSRFSGGERQSESREATFCISGGSADRNSEFYQLEGKNVKKRIASMITALALILTLLPATVMAAGATTYRVIDQSGFEAAMKQAKDGDIIKLDSSFILKNQMSNTDSLVIDKGVTIQGGPNITLTLWYCGILLDADVTFENITLGFASSVRNAILANGHKLTLNNVKKGAGTRDIHLFCGGQTGRDQAVAEGPHGQIIIRGDTDLGESNIYAGSISTNGLPNEFTKPATITIDSTARIGKINQIYATGALETYVSENDWFDFNNPVAPPTPSAENYPVSGAVTVNLYGTVVRNMDGNTGATGNYANVIYNGTNNLNDTVTLANIGGLDVKSGNLIPKAGSSFANENAAVTVAANSTLGLNNFGQELTVGAFTGGGNLLLGQNQKLTITGAVSGTATVGIGSIFNNQSSQLPLEGRTYIDAPQSQQGAFILAPFTSRPDIELVYQTDGTWVATGGQTSGDTIVDNFNLSSIEVEADTAYFAELPFQNAKFAANSATEWIADIPLEITVNGAPAIFADDTYIIDSLNLTMYVVGDEYDEALAIEMTDGTRLSGNYVIVITVPAEHSASGTAFTRTATVTVKTPVGTDIEIPVPVANTGLKYTGQEQIGVPEGAGYHITGNTGVGAGTYDATAILKTGYIWADGSKDDKIISWSIAKEDGPAAPTGLTGEAPSVLGSSDGKITGVAANMEYADNPDFTGAKDCVGTEATGLAAGDYYVRIKESANQLAGAATMVTVPDGPPTITSIAIASTDHKTSYKVGDALDVTGLTLTVTLSDGSTYTVPVTGGMVTGFDSTVQPPQTQTLCVTYRGQTTTYNITIAKADGPAAPMGLTGVAPSVQGGSDGKITGVAANMEYADNPDFTGAKDCMGTEIAGLTAGKYYVRVRATATHEAGQASEVTVPDGALKKIAAPQANVGLKYTGQEQSGVPEGEGYTLSGDHKGTNAGSYSATATLSAGYAWSDGSTDSKTIVWSIGKADGPTAPVGLTGVAPSAQGLGDGKITGTTADMEYAADSGFTNPTDCGAGETSGLTSGTYYVRIKGDGNREAGAAAIITVPDSGPSVVSIAINSTGHKTSYKVGDTLDVTGLTLMVTMSDNSTRTVAVTSGMVSNFDTSVPAQRRTLTILYEGQTTTYNITIAQGGSSSGTGSSTTTTTTINPDGSITTTVTNRNTGTVTATTKNIDGSITVVETRTDGTVITTDTAANGVKVQTVVQSGKDPVVHATIPTGVKAAVVTIPVVVTPGTVAVDAQTGEVVKLSVPTKDGVVVKLSKSANLILVDKSKGFVDINGHWAKDAIDFATAHGMFQGTSETTFSPNGTMTRGMIAVVLHNFEGNPNFTIGDGFNDVRAGSWYANGINWMMDKGITGGYGNGNFGPNDSITREQFVTFLYRYANSMGYSTAGGIGLTGFPDADSVSDYAVEAMSWAVGNGLIVGTDSGVLAPKSTANRAQVATVLRRFVFNLIK